MRDKQNGEGKVDEGSTAKPKVFYEDMLATSLTQTAKQSGERQTRPAAARCILAKSNVDHLDVNQEATEQVRLLDRAESDTRTLSADRIVPPTRLC